MGEQRQVIRQRYDPRYSCCFQCEISWNYVEWHNTPLKKGPAGMFPLCEACWAELTPKARLPYYRRLWEQWVHQSESDYHNGVHYLEIWPEIVAAVEAGL